jgi:hypothetical protein
MDEEAIQRAHFQALERLARLQHRLDDEEPIDLSLLPTPLYDAVMREIADETGVSKSRTSPQEDGPDHS